MDALTIQWGWIGGKAGTVTTIVGLISISATASQPSLTAAGRGPSVTVAGKAPSITAAGDAG